VTDLWFYLGTLDFSFDISEILLKAALKESLIIITIIPVVKLLLNIVNKYVETNTMLQIVLVF
jgi:hypothetical protein